MKLRRSGRYDLTVIGGQIYLRALGRSGEESLHSWDMCKLARQLLLYGEERGELL